MGIPTMMPLPVKTRSVSPASSSKSFTSESTGRSEYFSSKLSHLDEDDEICVKVPLEIARRWVYYRERVKATDPHGSGSASSFMGLHLGNSHDSISERYAQEKLDLTGRVEAIYRARNASLCNLDGSTCPYLTLQTIKHYHSPADKCVS